MLSVAEDMLRVQASCPRPALAALLYVSGSTHENPKGLGR